MKAVKALYQADGFVGRHMGQFVFGCVVIGIIFADTLSVLNSWNIALFAFMTFANSLDGGFKEIKAVILHPLPILITLGVLHIVLPLAALGLGNLLFPDAPLFTLGLVLEFAVPTGAASLMWVGLARGNTSLCLSIVLLDTLCSPVVIPLTMQVLVGSVVPVDALGMMRDMLFMVGIPALAALILYQVTKGGVSTTLKPKLSPFSKLAMLLIVMANATGCSPFLRNLTPTLILVIVTVFILCLVGFSLGYMSGRLLHQDFPTCETMTMNSGLRNISAGAVLAAGYFPGDVLFPVAFSPIFLQLTASYIVRILRHTKAGKADQAAYDAAQAARETVSQG